MPLARMPGAVSARKDSTALAALYFDDAGVAHLLGFPPVTDGSKALLEKFLLDAVDAEQLAIIQTAIGHLQRTPGRQPDQLHLITKPAISPA